MNFWFGVRIIFVNHNSGRQRLKCEQNITSISLNRTTKHCACHDFLVVVGSVIITSGLVKIKFFRNVEKSYNLVSCVVLEGKGNFSFKYVLYNNARKDVPVIISPILKFYGPIYLTSMMNCIIYTVRLIW